MIIRFVKMTFQEEKVPVFLKVFEKSYEKIRAFEGCEYLQLLQDKHNPQVIFTRSVWQSEDALNTYRNSQLFKSTWQRTKVLFSENPEAWSLKGLKELR